MYWKRLSPFAFCMKHGVWSGGGLLSSHRIATIARSGRSLINEHRTVKASLRATPCTHAQIVLGKRVRRYHDLVINLKDQLETAASTEGDRKHERDLLLLDKSLGGSAGGGQSDGWINGNYGEGQSMTDGAGSGGALDTMSLSSDTPPGGHVIWAGGACDGLSYGSVDELRVARESLQVKAIEKHAGQHNEGRVSHPSAETRLSILLLHLCVHYPNVTPNQQTPSSRPPLQGTCSPPPYSAQRQASPVLFE